MEDLEEIFKELDEKLKRHSEELSTHNAVIKFDIKGPEGGVWTASLKPGNTGITKTDGDSDCTVSAKDTDFIKLVNGEMGPERAILTGRVRLSGNVGMAIKLAGLFKS